MHANPESRIFVITVSAFGCNAATCLQFTIVM